MADDEPGLSEYVTRAIELLPSDDEPVVSTGTDEYALLVRRICAQKQSNGKPTDLKEGHIAGLVDQALSRAQGESDVFTAFEREFGKLSNAGEESLYKIYFPLNMRSGRNESPPATIEANETTIRKIESDDWESVIEDAQTAVTQQAATKDVPDLLQNGTETQLSQREHTFYLFEIESRESTVAYSSLQADLDIILGKLNFTAFDWVLEETSMDGLRSADRTRQNVINRPKIFLICQDGEYDSFRTPNRELERTGFRLPRGFKTDFERIRRFPLAGDTGPCNKELSRGFRALHAGLTAAHNESAFLYFWRGLEEITFHDRSDSSKNALERCLPLVHDYLPIAILQYVIEDLARKRNDIVHSGIESPVYERDVLLLRQMLYRSLDELLDLQKEYTRPEIRGVLNHGLDNGDSLQQSREDYQENIDQSKGSLEELNGAQRWRKDRASFTDVEQLKQF
ncbi:hypothetical protein [Haloarcula sp. Atlit-120R]|uniref:hypothetical protein n=1 Tax=Haloarcula sp. Atlit-120R TaxID=2282135 RepID=UPI0011C4A293|nr:hypothetical protein [Haloarcula sp. Atlit-120R]